MQRLTLHAGDCLEVMAGMEENSVDAVVCDPPYHLTSVVKRFGKEGSAPAKDYTGIKENATGAYARASRGFMGKQWGGGDTGRNEVEKRDPGFGDSGSVARFFYCAKASAKDRVGSKHPTVKPVALMRWLVRLVTPPNGVVLDPFAGTGTTGQAALEEGFRAVLIEREEEYRADIARRMAPLIFDEDF